MYIQKFSYKDCIIWNAISSTLGSGDLGYGALKDREDLFFCDKDLFFCDKDWDVWDFLCVLDFLPVLTATAIVI